MESTRAQDERSLPARSARAEDRTRMLDSADGCSGATATTIAVLTCHAISIIDDSSYDSHRDMVPH
ncbi:hypothetical protein THAOC_18294, partial [Thalassiosira oceanica]